MEPNWDSDQNLPTLVLMILAIAAFVMYRWRRRWQPSTTAHGSAAFEAEQVMQKAGLFGGKGLILGRAYWSRRLLSLPKGHALLLGGTGAGKGIGVIIPTLLSYAGSCVCFDTKSDLIATTAARRRRMGHRIIDLAPFAGGKDKWNILDAISDGPMLVDHARAIAEMLVIRIGTEPDPHWTESAVMLICGVLVFVLMCVAGPERNLNSVRDIIAEPALLEQVAIRLIAMGGIPARMGHHIQGLQEKERAGVVNTAVRSLCFLDSELVAAAVASSTFDPLDLCKPVKVTIFMRIGADQLEAQRNLLRCWIGMLVRLIGVAGNERSQVLFLIDEASALGSLPALEESLVRGRSNGTRLLLAYQSESQVRAAFPTKPTLIHDNCDAIIYLCPPTGYETAEAISKRIGDMTQETSSYSESESQSWSQSANQGENGQTSRSCNTNWSVHGRALLKPEEILVMSKESLIAFVRGLRPIWAHRLSWFTDPAFGRKRPLPLWWWLLVMVAIGLIAWNFAR